MSTANTQLANFDAARLALQRATSIDEVRDIRDKAEALRAYHKQVGESLEMQNQCAEIKLRAERRAGEIIVEMPKQRPGEYQRDHGDPVAPSLAELGIGKGLAHRWRVVASLPEPEFEGHIAETKRAGKELTTVGVIKIAKQRVARTTADPEDQLIHEDVTDDLQVFIGQGIKFGTIYADPAWRYGNQGTRAATDNHYETMTVDEICDLPVRDLSADDCHLHLWTTNAFLQDSFRVMDAWGFTYKSVMVWVKPQMGIGNYWRVSHEFLMLGVKGNAKFRDRSIMSWIQHERTAHSAKPEAFRKAIEAVSPGPYLEMFSRVSVPNWSAWGNQVTSNLYSPAEALS